MTRFLSEALQANEPHFRLGIKQLESSHGNPSNDIRLSSEITQKTAEKLKSFGFDPSDTTAEELYLMLLNKIITDDRRLTRTLQTHAATHISAEADVVDGMVHDLNELPESKNCFAIKTTAMRSIIKKIPPKKAMKALGYRSLESFLKHERLATIMAAAWYSENQKWHNQLFEQYKRLKSSDFENRAVEYIRPKGKKWDDLAKSIVDAHKHNLISFKELGTIILLPLPKNLPNGVVTASFCLALHELNEIRACSTYLKLCQVRPDFGKVVWQIVVDEPNPTSELLDQTVPWHLIQRFYSNTSSLIREELFGPHVRSEDLSWQSIESMLSRVDENLSFWKNSSHLGFLKNHQPVSLNILDSALNVCNNLPFEKRLTKAFQKSLWQELLLRYLKPEAVEQSVLNNLEPKLIAETATV